jgi:ABC-type sulfate/molybdate transport systems ATPase subunit
VRGTLQFVLRAARVPRAEWPARVRELLELVDLPGFGDRKPVSLSGGEAQRLALARALAARPRLLLLDEPLGPLDQELRGALLARLGELHRRLGFAAVHVTHDPREAAGLADRVLRLDGGSLAPAPLHPEQAAP